MKRKIRVGSRESKLAIVQSQLVIKEITKIHPNIEIELITMKTKGDMILDKRLDKIGGKGLFIKEIENALLNDIVDIAVHSMKDMPADIAKGLKISAISKSEDVRDVLVTRNGARLEELKKGAVIGTSSKRRETQLYNLREDLVFKMLRGNVNTRIAKLLAGEYDGIVLAAAGLKRLDLYDSTIYAFEPDIMIPAVGQGVMCVETREDFDIDFLLTSIHCEQTKFRIDAERAFLKKLNGGCSIPIGAYAILEGDQITLTGMYGEETGYSFQRATVKGDKCFAHELGEELALRFLSESSCSIPPLIEEACL